MASDHSAGPPREGLDALTPALGTAGYRVCGTIVGDYAAVFSDISATGDLLAGRTDGQGDGGRVIRADGVLACFGLRASELAAPHHTPVGLHMGA